jgi:hypothetical protein
MNEKRMLYTFQWFNLRLKGDQISEQYSKLDRIQEYQINRDNSTFSKTLQQVFKNSNLFSIFSVWFYCIIINTFYSKIVEC